MSDWQFTLGQLDGIAISGISARALNRKLQFILNRPAKLEFEVPADAPEVATVHSDGRPYLAPMRTVKAWQGDTLRFAGYVWQLSATGDADRAMVKVVCFDPLVRLGKRYVAATIGGADYENVTFDNVDAAEVVETILSRLGNESSTVGTGISVVDGSFATLDPVTVTYSLKPVLAAMVELADATGLDYTLEYRDDPGTFLGNPAGLLANIHVHERAGTDRPETVLAWGVGPANANAVEWLRDVQPLANRIKFYGGVGADGVRAVTPQVGGSGDTIYGRHNAVEGFPDITSRAYLDALLDAHLTLRVSPKEEAHFTPQAGLPTSLTPWDDFELGDTITVAAGPQLLGGFEGVQRIYGFDLAIDNDAGERLGRIITVPEAA